MNVTFIDLCTYFCSLGWDMGFDCISLKSFPFIYFAWYQTVIVYVTIYNITCDLISGCPRLRQPIHGTLSSRSVGYGMYVTVTCDTSYTLVGESILQCVSGSWSGTVGTCEAGKQHLQRSNNEISAGFLLFISDRNKLVMFIILHL